MEVSESLTKYNKLKRFGAYVSEKIGAVISDVLLNVDCLFGGDIYTKRDMLEKIAAISDCASIVELRKYDTGEVKIHNANYCHNPVVCPICADRVSKRRRSMYTIPIERAVRRFAVDKCSGDWKSEYPEQYTGVYLATATIKNGSILKDRIDILQDSIKRMRKMGQKRTAGRSGGEWSKVRAGLSNVEIKIGSGSGDWHVHAHFLLFTDAPIDIKTSDSPYFITTEKGNRIQVSKFNYEWYQATGGQGYNFDVRPIQFKSDIHGRECKTFSESVEMQAQEVIKYSAQLSSGKGIGILSAEQYVELIQRRGNRRLFNAIGLMRCDKRNPESFMTINEREMRRLEYVESNDKKTYEIYSSLWQNGGTYGQFQKQEGAIFANSDDMNTGCVIIRRRAFMAQTAIWQGEYRKSRNCFYKSRELHNNKIDFETLLDEHRNAFRNKVKDLWQHYGQKDYLPEFLTDWNSTGMAGLRKRYLSAA